ncbi:unnamed protein product, partial [Symbiodinium natans]
REHLAVGIEVTFDQTLATLAKSELLARACLEATVPGLATVLLLVRAWAQRRRICGQRQGDEDDSSSLAYRRSTARLRGGIVFLPVRATDVGMVKAVK